VPKRNRTKIRENNETLQNGKLGCWV